MSNSILEQVLGSVFGDAMRGRDGQGMGSGGLGADSGGGLGDLLGGMLGETTRRWAEARPSAVAEAP